MRRKKRRWEDLAFYDWVSIEERVAAMAQKGWLLEQAGTPFWRYRKTEPADISVWVHYSPTASEYDSGLTWDQKKIKENCEEKGWLLAAWWGSMGIFYKEGTHPAPVETDSKEQLQAVHRIMKRTALPGYLVLAGLCIMWLALLFSQFFQEPAEFLANPATFYMVPGWILILVSVLGEVRLYYKWKRNAEKEMHQGGIYRKKPGRRITSVTIVLAMLFVGLALIGRGPGFVAVWLATILAWIVFVTAAVSGVRNYLKKKGASRTKNWLFTTAAAVVCSLVLMAVLSAAAVSGIFQTGRKPVGTYDKGGREVEVYDDPIPLEIKDLRDPGCGNWSSEAERKETVALAQTRYLQAPLTEKQGIPELSYTVTEVKAGFLYDFLKTRMVNQRKDQTENGEIVFVNHYEPMDPEPWRASGAYRLAWGNGYLDRYLLFYEDRIVEIRLDWEPSEWQMGVVGEKLGFQPQIP